MLNYFNKENVNDYVPTKYRNLYVQENGNLT